MSYDGTLKFDTSIDDTGLEEGLGKLQSIAKDALGVLAGNLMTQATNALVNLGREAIAAGTQLESGMAKVSTLFTGTDEELGALKEEIRALSTASGLAADGLAEAAYSALSASVPAEELGAILERSTRLAAAGFTDVETALSATAKTMNAYGTTGEEAMDRIQKVLIQTQNMGITTVDELGRSLAQVTPTAASFSVAFEQVGAALAVMTAQGTGTAQATTQLNSLIAELGKSGTTAAKNLTAAAEGSEYAGMTFKEMMDAGATLDEVLGLMSDYADQTGVSMVDLFSSIEAGKAALSIFSQGGQTFRADLAEMATEIDVVGEAYDKVTDTVEFKSQKLKTGMQNLASGLYDLVNEPIKDLQDVAIDALSRITEGLSEGGVVGIAEALIGILEDAAAKVQDIDWGAIAQTITDGISAFIEGDGLGRVLRAATSMATGLVSGLAATFSQLMPTATQAFTYALATLTEQLPDFINAGVDLLTGLAEGFIAAAPEVLSGIASIGANLTDALVSGIEQLTAQVVPLIPDILQAIVDIFIAKKTVLLEGAVEVFMALADALPTVVDALASAVPGIVSSILDALSSQSETLLSGAVYVFQSLVSAFKQAAAELASMLPDLIAQVGDTLIDATPLLLEAALEFFSGIVDAIPSLLDLLLESLPSIITTITGFLVSALPQLVEAATRLLMTIVEAIPGVVSSLVENFPTIISAILSALTAAVPAVLETAIDLFLSIVQAIPQTVASLAASLPDIISAIFEALTGAAPELLELSVGLLGEIVSAVPRIIPELIKAGGNIVAGLWDGIKGAWSSLKDGFTDFVGGLVDSAAAALGINSPSRRFRQEVGAWIPPGISEGIDEAMPAALDDLDDQADKLIERMRGAVQGDLGDVDLKLTTASQVAVAPVVGAQTASEPAKWEQTNNYYVPVVSPSEAARTQREALRAYVGGVQ